MTITNRRQRSPRSWQRLLLLASLPLALAHENLCPSCTLEMETSTAVIQVPTPQLSPAPEGNRITTEALPLIGATEYHAAGIVGAGVKVAVIDEAFDGFINRIAEGELPPDLITRRFIAGVGSSEYLGEGNSQHGTACAEIVHDIAPGAQLYLIQVDSFIETLEPVLHYLRDEGVRVLSISVSTLSPARGDGSGRLAGSPTPLYPLLEAARASGMLIVKSAGNYAQQHYQATFSDTDGNGWHEFMRSRMGVATEALPLRLGQGKSVNVTLSWDDWGDDPLNPAASSTYQLTLVSPQGIELARSAASRLGTAPVQSLAFTPNLDGEYAIRIRRESAAPRDHTLDVFAIGEDAAFTAFTTPERSLAAAADSASALTVGAVHAQTGRLVPYSSQGPTVDGRIKPDLSSYSFVSVASPAFGPYGFGGTSAAAPHVAGMAALLLGIPENSDMTVDDLQAQLLSFAADRGEPGPDPLWGAGIAQLPPLSISVRVPAPDEVAPTPHSDPRRRFARVIVERSDGSPLPGLPAAAFQVQIGAEAVRVFTVRNLDRTYLLEISIPPGLPPGVHPLIITVLEQSASTTSITLPETGTVAPGGIAPGGITLDVTLSTATPGIGEPVLFQASFAGYRTPHETSRIIATIAHPSGVTDTLTFQDDGRHGDGVSGNGLFGAWYARFSAPGRYHIQIAAVPNAWMPLTEIPVESQEALVLSVGGSVADTDGDGLPDTWERHFGTNSAVSDALKDLDADGLVNLAEFRNGTDPLNWDTDGDGLTDGGEVAGYFQTSPMNSDTDFGGVSDGAELERGTNPLNPADDQRDAPPVFLPLQIRAFHSRPRPRNHALVDGALWLATEGGVVRWDTASRTYVRFTAAHGLSHESVFTILPDAAGNLWAATANGISRLDANALASGATWQTYGTADGLPHPIVRDLALATNGNLWAATANGVARFDGSHWQAVPDAPITDLHAITVDRRGRVWAGGQAGLAVLDGTGWRLVPQVQNTWVTAITADDAGQLWLGTWGNGLAVLPANLAGPPVWVTRDQGLADEHVVALLQGEDGTLWVRTLSGMSSFDGSGWRTYVTDATILRRARYHAEVTDAVHRWFGSYPLTDLPDAMALIATAEQRPWFGVTGSRSTALGDWFHLQTIEHDPVTALTVNSHREIWAVTGSALSSFDGDTWAMLTPLEGLPDRNIMALAADTRGAIWAGTDGSGALRVDSPGWRRYEVHDGLVSSFIHAIAALPDGAVWFGSGGGLSGVSRLQPETGAWLTMARADVLGGRAIRAIASAPSGTVWFATEQSVARFSGGMWAAPIRTPAPVLAAAVDADERLWIGSTAGLAYLRGDRWIAVEAPGAPQPHGIRRILITPSGELWCATSAGVHIFDPQSQTWRSLTTLEGLLSDDVRDLALDQDGVVWFATDKGLSQVTPIRE